MKYVKLFFVALIIFFLGYMIVLSLFQDKSNLKTAEVQYTQAVYNQCLAERNLAGEKARAWAEGKLVLTADDLIRLNEKKEMDCAF